jgi:crotonobetainyl-CoA:carnitine CoA-transferase CaiB-like acyl-CoA transferase
LLKTAEEWAAILQQVGVPAAVVIENLTDLHNDTRFRSRLTPGSYTKVASPWSFQ